MASLWSFWFWLPFLAALFGSGSVVFGFFGVGSGFLLFLVEGGDVDRCC